MTIEEKHRRLVEYIKKTTGKTDLEVVRNVKAVESDLPSLDLRRRGQAAGSPAAITRPVVKNGMTRRQIVVAEQLICPEIRPVIDIINGDFACPTGQYFVDLYTNKAKRKNILEAIPGVGRIGSPSLPLLPFLGTGFVVGENLLMTNRHVAANVALGLGNNGLSLRTGYSALIDFKKERKEDDAGNSQPFEIMDVVMIHPYWDMALFRTKGLEGIQPLTLSVEPVALPKGGNLEIAVIGYPALDPFGDIDLQNKVFNSTFNVKRLQPGQIHGFSEVESFERNVSALAHDASTMGGNSGSVVLDTLSGLVVGLHFGGQYLVSNYAVPAAALAQDSRVVAAGVRFRGETTTAVGPWDDCWKRCFTTESEIPPSPGSVVSPGVGSSIQTSLGAAAGEVRFTVPLEISVRIGGQVSLTGASPVIGGTSLADALGAVPVPGPWSLATIRTIPVAPKIETPTEPVGSPELMERSGFDLELAVFLAQASQAAYGDATITDAWAKAQGFTSSQAFDRGNIQGFWCTAGDNALLVFRGTSNPAQWLRDARFIPAVHEWGLVHIGFLKGIYEVEQDLAVFDAVANSAKRVWIAGHSLGGALALLAAARFKKQGLVPSIYTYGQPRVGFWNFADRFGLELPGRLLRFVNQADIVARVPPGLLYQHCGLVKRIVRSGQLENVGTAFPPQMIEHDAPPCSEQEFAQIQAALAAMPAVPVIQPELGRPVVESVDFGAAFSCIHDHYIGEYIRLLLSIKNTSDSQK